MNLFKAEADSKFDTDIISSPRMETTQSLWANIVRGIPPWLDKEDGIETLNFAKFVSYYCAKKICLELKVNISGSPRADYIQKCIDAIINKKTLRDHVEDACELGGIILKPNGNYMYNNAIDFILPGDFAITDKTVNGDIMGAIFIDRLQKGNVFYTRLEWHHFTTIEITEGETGRVYAIENKAFKSNGAESLGREIPLTELSEWANLEPEIFIDKVEKPLFAYYKMPYNNTIDYASPEGVSVFHNCIKELKDLDIAWSRKSGEVDDSKHLTFIDEKSMTLPADKQNPRGRKIKLPRFVQGLRAGIEDGKSIQEHVATILSDVRIADINSILAMISTKMGFSQGQFILDRKSGKLTATQIESDDNETIETITDMRDNLSSALLDLVYALDKYCDVFFDMPSGYVNALDEKVYIDDWLYYRDLLTTFEQDRERAWRLVQAGAYSKKSYLMKYEGMSEEDVEMELEAARNEKQSENEGGLFGEE